MSVFKKSKNTVEANEENGNPTAAEAVKKDDSKDRSKIRIDVFIFVLSFIAAVILWIYAVIIGDATRQFQNVPVTVKRVSIVSAQGYDIQYTDLKVNFTIQGNGATISQISENSIEAYVDLSTINLTEITDTKIVQLPIIFNVPSNVRCFDKSQEYLEVKITKNVHNFQDTQN